MPKPRDGESKDDFVERCIPVVLEDGTAEDDEQAIAVCGSMWEEAKKSLWADDFLIARGDSVKALGGGRIGGYLVRFTGPEQPDLDGDYFNSETDFDLREGLKSSIYFHHALDPKIRQRKLGSVDVEERDFGIWVEGQLALRDRYEQFIYGRIQAGKMGWSSGTVPHLVLIERSNEGIGWIRRWPLGLDASITPTPADPINRVLGLKAYRAAYKAAFWDWLVDADVDTAEGQEREGDDDKTRKLAIVKARYNLLKLRAR